MGYDHNCVSLVGRVVSDAVVSNIGESSVAKYSIAVGYYKKDNPKAVSFFDVEDWNCRIVDYLKKGKQVAILGELRQDRWRHEGTNKSRVKVLSIRTQLLATVKEQGDGIIPEKYEDDIPF